MVACKNHRIKVEISVLRTNISHILIITGNPGSIPSIYQSLISWGFLLLEKHGCNALSGTASTSSKEICKRYSATVLSSAVFCQSLMFVQVFIEQTFPFPD